MYKYTLTKRKEKEKEDNDEVCTKEYERGDKKVGHGFPCFKGKDDDRPKSRDDLSHSDSGDKDPTNVPSQA